MNKRISKSLYYTLAASLILLGISMMLIGGHGQIDLTTRFYGVTRYLSSDSFNFIAAAILIAAAVLSLLALRRDTLRKYLGILLVVISLVPILTLFSPSMYIQPLGGFPAIGTGQGVIKYFALLSIGLLIAVPDKLSFKAKVWIAAAPVMLVLLWIGGMKFTMLEAQGIKPLVESSPFMSWMYRLWDLQTTSNIIGVYDMIAVALLGLSLYVRRALLPAVIMSGAVFIVTQTFLFTWQGALSDQTILSTGGHFLIKDLWFLANLMMLWFVQHENERAITDT